MNFEKNIGIIFKMLKGTVLLFFFFYRIDTTKNVILPKKVKLIVESFSADKLANATGSISTNSTEETPIGFITRNSSDITIQFKNNEKVSYNIEEWPLLAKYFNITLLNTNKI